MQLGHDASAYRLLIVSVIIAFGSVWLSEALMKKIGSAMKLEIRRLSLRLEQFALEVNTDLHNARTGILDRPGRVKRRCSK